MCPVLRRLHALLDALSIVFASEMRLWVDGPQAHVGYRVFLHNEKVKVSQA